MVFSRKDFFNAKYANLRMPRINYSPYAIHHKVHGEHRENPFKNLRELCVLRGEGTLPA